MSRSFQNRHANEVVGVFVLITIAVLAFAAVFGPHTRRWLTPTRKLAVRLPPEGSLGLRKGADVLILGSVVGSVDDISVNDNGEMEADVSVRGNFIRFVRQDSRAVIRKPLGIGDASIEISRGKGDPLPFIGAAIECTSDKAPTQMLEETLADIRTEAVPVLHELRNAVTEYTKLAADLRAQQPGIHDAVDHFNHVASSVENGKGAVGMLLNDPAAADTVRQSLPKLTASLDDLRATTASLRTVVSSAPELERSAQRTVDQAPALILQADETLRQLQRLVEAMQHNWLLSGSMSHASPAPGPRIDANTVGTDR